MENSKSEIYQKKIISSVIHCLMLSFLCAALTLNAQTAETWQIDSSEDWKAASARSDGLNIKNGMIWPSDKTGNFQSTIKKFPQKVSAKSILFEQSPVWKNWTAIERIGPVERANAPVALSLGPGEYWIFAQEQKGENPYVAWHSTDIKKWTKYGPVTESVSRWTTTAEYVDGKAYIYYDFPNDQDPHLYIDDDLTDGTPGENMGIAFKDPSDGSDAAVIRDLDGKFHCIYEDWSPIDASKHSWDSPLAGHAVSVDGKGNWEIKNPVVDERTNPTGTFKEYKHPYWAKEDPKNYKKGHQAKYEVHEPEQNAYGDWAAICIGGQYYLFGDFHPAGKSKKEMSVAWFTSPDINNQFTFCGSIGHGHPDPDVFFAEGQFYLITQTRKDFISPGPWVEKVEARVGVDTTGDGNTNQWIEWQEVKESYDHIKNFAKQISCEPASIDLSSLPSGYGFAFEFRATDTTENQSSPLIDKVILSFQ